MGVSQVVDPVLGAQVGHAWLLEQIAEHGSEKDRKLLEELEPLQVTQRYFELLEAPVGKHLVIFEASAHTPFLREAQLFNQDLVRVK